MRFSRYLTGVATLTAVAVLSSAQAYGFGGVRGGARAGAAVGSRGGAAWGGARGGAAYGPSGSFHAGVSAAARMWARVARPCKAVKSAA
jgi:hypothetical protein